MLKCRIEGLLPILSSHHSELFPRRLFVIKGGPTIAIIAKVTSSFLFLVAVASNLFAMAST